MELKVNGTTIKLIKGDITKEKVDAIVNAANSLLKGGGGVDGAIHQAGGPVILNECKKIIAKLGKLPTGEAVITTGGNLPAKYVIHTVGPVWSNENKGENELLKNAYYNSFKLGAQKGIKSIAFPSISTGIYGYPFKKASIIALASTLKFLQNEKHEYKEIRFITFSDRDYSIFKKIFLEK
ncbi:MAG: O-acetyl-ADP-ribose deacetylase [Spirochaetes bacterium]|nr:O-acetyl-ADP-ribose deacetylase [Spirochaetota bacterium]